MHERPHLREGDLARPGDRPDAPGPLASRRPELARRNVNVPRHARVPTWQQDEARLVVITELGDLSDDILAGDRLPPKVAEARTVRREEGNSPFSGERNVAGVGRGWPGCHGPASCRMLGDVGAAGGAVVNRGDLSRLLHAAGERTPALAARQGTSRARARANRSAWSAVAHVTRRPGHPLTLVLTKTDALFEPGAAAVDAAVANLAWLAATAPRGP